MAKQTKEIAVIDFEKFSVAQLPELKGKKEEIKSVIEANPIVEIVDNGTYELAKKSRTAVRSLRTSLEGEQKAVKKKIKEHVLDVVDKEYDTIVLGVKSAEKERQDPIDVWETKKEEERKEKARLEELRVNQIKDAIQTFKNAWIETVDQMTFERIENFNEMFEKYSSEFDREKLAEYEVLFDDALLVIRQLADSKIKTLTEQEQIRIDNLLIQEKNAENARISKFSIDWNSNIDTVKISDVEDVKEVFKKAKIKDLKHFQSNFDEVYSALEKRLNSQIEFISFQEKQRLEQEEIDKKNRIAQEKFAKEQAEIAEKNRIAQKKFLAEKKEFEEKQAEAKFQERCKKLVELGFDLEVFEIEYPGNPRWMNLKFSAQKLSDIDWQIELDWAKEQIENRNKILQTTQEVEFEEEAPIVYKAFGNQSQKVLENIKNKTHEIADFKEEQEYVEQVSTKSEITWESILEQFNESGRLRSTSAFIDWLQENYNVPTKK
jgi:hypothetical protein